MDLIIYQVTVYIEAHSESEWYRWMVDIHIPEVLNSGYFKQASIAKMIEPQGENERRGYQIRYQCDSMASLQAYQTHAAPALQKDHTQRFKGQFQAQRCILELLDSKPKP